MLSEDFFHTSIHFFIPSSYFFIFFHLAFTNLLYSLHPLINAALCFLHRFYSGNSLAGAWVIAFFFIGIVHR